MSAPANYFTRDGEYGHHVLEGAEDFVSVATVGEYGYSWHLLDAWYSPSRDRFYWASGSGCSCNSLMDGVSTIGHLQDGDRDALVRAVEAEFGADEYTLSASALAKEIHTIRTWRYTPEESA